MYLAREKNKPKWVGKVLAVLVACGLLYGGYRAYTWYTQDYVVGNLAEAAPTALETARSHMEKGESAEARKVLSSLVAKVEGHEASLQALIMLARLDRNEGYTDKALNHLEKAVKDYAGMPGQHEAVLLYAKLLEDVGRADEAAAQYAEIRRTAPPALRAPATLAVARGVEKAGEIDDAHALFKTALNEAEWDSTTWREAADALGRINTRFVFSPGPAPESEVYTVEPGDSLTSIGMKLNITLGQLMRANGIEDPARLAVGEALKYTPKDFRIVIERSKCRLFLLDRNGIFKIYPIGLGMPGHETTLGSYTLGNKQKDPAWFKPGVGEIPPGAPENELGTRWMPLVPAAEGLPEDLGIHGTIAPESIGGFTSHGCARMLNEDVEELYDLVVRATPVTIVETVTPAELESLH